MDDFDPYWDEKAWGHLRDFVRIAHIKDPDKRFMAEDVRAWAQGQGLAKPAEPRAWGAVFNRARRAGLITACGYAESNNRQAHKRPTQVWRLSAQ